MYNDQLHILVTYKCIFAQVLNATDKLFSGIRQSHEEIELHVHHVPYTIISLIFSMTNCIYYVDEKNPTMFRFNNSEKLVQILLEFSLQILGEGYEFALAKFRRKNTLSVNQNLRFKPT